MGKTNKLACVLLSGWLGLTTYCGNWAGGYVVRTEYENKKFQILESYNTINPSYPPRPSELISETYEKSFKDYKEKRSNKKIDKTDSLTTFWEDYEVEGIEEELSKIEKKYGAGSLDDIVMRSIGIFFGLLVGCFPIGLYIASEEGPLGMGGLGPRSLPQDFS